MNKKYKIDEFVSFQVFEDKNIFKIILEGEKKYKDLISFIVGNIEIPEETIKEFE